MSEVKENERGVAEGSSKKADGGGRERERERYSKQEVEERGTRGAFNMEVVLALPVHVCVGVRLYG